MRVFHPDSIDSPPTPGWCWEEGQFRLGAGRIQGWGLLFWDGGCGPGLHLQLYRGGDAWEVSLHLLRLYQAAEALDAGDLLGVFLSPHPAQVQVAAVPVPGCLAHHPSLHFKLVPLETFPDESGTNTGLDRLLHWCDGPLHVHLWLHQAVQYTQIFLSSNIPLSHRNSCGLNSQVMPETFLMNYFTRESFDWVSFSVLFVRTWLWSQCGAVTGTR